MRHFLCCTLAMLAWLGTARAQPAQDAAAAALDRARAAIAAGPCRAATARAAAPPALLSDPTVREASYHRILIEGCGQRIQRNYLALVLPDGTRRMVEMLPGTTVTDPVLQRDAMNAATMAAATAAPACRQVRPRAAEFDGADREPQAPRRTRPWTESWIFEACGRLLAVPMRFTPTERGTSFSAGAGVRPLD
jgi:hypothetical protein